MGVPWLVATSVQSLPLWSRGLLSSAHVSGRPLSLTYQDTRQHSGPTRLSRASFLLKIHNLITSFAIWGYIHQLWRLGHGYIFWGVIIQSTTRPSPFPHLRWWKWGSSIQGRRIRFLFTVIIHCHQSSSPISHSSHLVLSFLPVPSALHQSFLPVPSNFYPVGFFTYFSFHSSTEVDSSSVLTDYCKLHPCSQTPQQYDLLL